MEWDSHRSPVDFDFESESHSCDFLCVRNFRGGNTDFYRCTLGIPHVEYLLNERSIGQIIYSSIYIRVEYCKM